MHLDKSISDATLEVFASMIFMDIVPGDTITDKKAVIESNISSMIGIAGDLKGILAVHCPGFVAKSITGAMLGLEVDELDEDVQDAIGEIANMVAGGLKVSLAEIGKNSELAIPTTVIGKSIRSTGLSSATRFIVPFTTPAGEFGIELKYVLA